MRIILTVLCLVCGNLLAVAQTPTAKNQARPKPLATLESPRLVVSVEKNAVLVLQDKLARREWRQGLTEKSARIDVDRVEPLSRTGLRLYLRTQGRAFTAVVSLVADGNEVEVAVYGEALPGRLFFPLAFLPPPESALILVIKEGLAIPVRDTTVFFDSQKRGVFQFYEGHNAAMPFWGFANPDGSGLMTLILTPNDAGFQISRREGLLTDQVAWVSEFGRFGYARKLRYVPLARGGYVAMAQRYRAQAEQDGLVRTLREKIRENPNVERLLGAADVWFTDTRHEIKDFATVAKQLQQSGVTRAIFAGGRGWWEPMSREEIAAINALGFLPGQYDGFQDVMPPTNFSKIHVSPTFRKLQKAWPDDIVLQADGVPINSWPVTGKDGRTYYSGRLADKLRLQYAQELLPRDLAEAPYPARFLDTEASTAWTEDYNPRHRTTRSETRAARMRVLDFLSRDSRLVTGSEGLLAFAVPHLDYFEGVGPIEPFRVPSDEHPFKTFPADHDWGTNMTRLLEVSHRYLIPLWSLVFHDCVVAYPRWDEANNKYANPLWQTKQALLCALNGRPPIFMFDVKWWCDPANQKALAQIYRQTGPLALQVGTARMTDHRWLDAAGDVQRTRFDNGVTVTVNFGRAPYKTVAGAMVAPSGCLVTTNETSAAAAPATETVWLDALDLGSMRQDSGTPQMNRSFAGQPLSVGGRKFARGVGTHANSTYRIALNGSTERFTANIGVDDAAGGAASVVFQVVADGKKVFRSGVLKPGQAAQRVDVNLQGVKTLYLLVTDAGDDSNFDAADWADAQFAVTGVKPVPFVAPSEKPYPLTPKPGPAPRINGPKIYGARPGHPFLYRIPAQGERPMTFSASGLPAGLQLDARSGIVSGTTPARGEYEITFHAKNPQGSDYRRFKLVSGDTLALTPPMGWNHWYAHYDRITDAMMREAADIMVSSGMADVGYQYVNIDGCWQCKPGSNDPKLNGPPRDEPGNLNPKKSFPDMKALTDHIHSRGLKAGIYSSPGPLDCAGYTGSYQHEAPDARRFADWGFDFLKYDWCSYGSVAAKPLTLAEMKRPYQLMGGLLRQQSRDIVLNLCQYGMGEVWKWGAEVGGHSWRTAGDLGFELDRFYEVALKNCEHRDWQKPGAWNDPDYIQIGYIGNARGSGGGLPEPCSLTPTEQYSFMSLWALMAAPVFYSGDMSRLDEFTLNVLCNPEVIEVNQDPLGQCARIVKLGAETLLLVKDLADGTKAVGLCNTGEAPAPVTAKWSDLGVAGSQTVRDLWRQKDCGRFGGEFKAEVPRRGVVLIRVGTPQP